MRDWLKCGRAARESIPDRLRRFSLVALGRSLVLLGLALFLQALRSSLLAAPSALVLVGHGASSAACPARRLRFIVSHPYEYSRLDRETVEIGASSHCVGSRAGCRSGCSVVAIRCDPPVRFGLELQNYWTAGNHARSFTSVAGLLVLTRNLIAR